jgi:hypothetical protein
MKAQGMTDKERALLEATRREAAVGKTAPRASPSASRPAAPVPALASRSGANVTPLGGRTVIGWDHPAAQTTPLDTPTVAGWDHPAARGDGASDAARWERIAALMEAEREASREKNRRARRVAVIFLCVLCVLVLFAGAMILAR